MYRHGHVAVVPKLFTKRNLFWQKMKLAGLHLAPEAPELMKSYMDISGNLNFDGKAVLRSTGVDFSSGVSFKVNINEFDIQSELGKGQYGVVSKVFHRPTKVVMAMKQIYLDLADSTFKQILMELEVLHKSRSPFIVDFYGAFFVDCCVYYCMEYMNAGSLDRLYCNAVNEAVLGKIAFSVISGLKFLVDEFSVMHRDVRPSNILVNRHGHFGVSGQLSKSLAKTYIGCQSYMAPERIQNTNCGAYTIAADVYSLGICLWETAMGKYPFPPEKYDSLFAQLCAIVSEQLPPLNSRFSNECQTIILSMLTRNPEERPSYSQLLDSSFIRLNSAKDEEIREWARI